MFQQLRLQLHYCAPLHSVGRETVHSARCPGPRVRLLPRLPLDRVTRSRSPVWQLSAQAATLGSFEMHCIEIQLYHVGTTGVVHTVRVRLYRVRDGAFRFDSLPPPSGPTAGVASAGRESLRAVCVCVCVCVCVSRARVCEAAMSTCAAPHRLQME